ncbi:MAG: flagellar hook-basal body complex protein [Rickettsiales bacterium]
MGLAGARNSAVTGLQAQSASISIAADNIANASTPGYKATTGLFSTLVTNSGTGSGGVGYSSGGVTLSPKTLVDKQGLLETTGRATDLAISGKGFFSVQDDAGNVFLTRAGAFDANNAGELVNSAGYKLMAWPLDDNGRLPGQLGNVNTTAAESVDSLVAVDTNTASGAATATSSLAIGANLNAAENVFQGATVTLDPAGTRNRNVGQNDILGMEAGMAPGDSLTLESSGEAVTFDYGGFARSHSLADAPLLGTGTPSASFTTGGADGLQNNDKFQITTNKSGAVTLTFTQNSPDTTAGEFNSLTTLAEALNRINGLTARIDDSRIYVSSEDANDAMVFADVAGSGLSGKLGFANVAAGSGTRFNTLKGLADAVNQYGQFGAKVNSPSTASSLEIFSADPLQTVTVTKNSYTATANPISSRNGMNKSSDLIVPTPGATSMTSGLSTLSFSDGTNAGAFTYGGLAATKAVNATTSVFGATSAAGAFVDGTGGLNAGDSFTLSNGTNTVTLTYTPSSPNTATGQFNSMETLAAAIDANANFRGRIVDGAIYISASNPNLGITLSATSGITAAQLNAGLGGDFPTTTGSALVAAGSNRFNTLDDLNALVNGITGFASSVDTTPNAGMTVSVAPARQLTIGGASNAQLLSELGLGAGDVGDTFFTELGMDSLVSATQTAGIVATSYDPNDVTKNMAGGNVSPHFSRNVTFFDSLGTSHDFKVAFLKTNEQTWSVEIYALDPTDVTGVTAGQIASGTIQFNGDGSLKTISPSLSVPVSVGWSNGAENGAITIDWGTAGAPSGTEGAVIGQTDGLRQFDSSYNVEFVEQNGVASGLFTGVEVEDDGTINARFSNGEVKAIYKIPVVAVSNPNALAQRSGNVFTVTQDSGEINLKEAGKGSAGTLVSGTLEGSTADITEELTRTIGIQSNYNANATLISTVKSMEEELTRRL